MMGSVELHVDLQRSVALYDLVRKHLLMASQSRTVLEVVSNHSARQSNGKCKAPIDLRVNGNE